MFFPVIRLRSKLFTCILKYWQCSFKKGNIDEAIKMFEDAIKLDKNNSIYHFNLGVALTQCNDHEGAAKAYKECLKLNQEFTSLQ